MPSSTNPSQINIRPGQTPSATTDGTALTFLTGGGGNSSASILPLLSGLDDKYRRNTTPSGVPDTPGSGRDIQVDGSEVALVGAERLEGNAFPGNWGALLDLTQYPRWPHSSYSLMTGPWPNGDGGWIGIFHESPYQGTTSTAVSNQISRSGPALLDVNLRWVNVASISGQNVLTKISGASAGAVLNPGGVPNQVQCAPGDYFSLSSGDFRTTIRLGLDLLRVRYVDGTSETFVISSIVSSDTVSVHRITGPSDLPGWVGSDIAVTGITVYQPNLFVGGSDLTDYSGGLPDNTLYSRPFVVGWAPPITDDPDAASENLALPSMFLSPVNSANTNTSFKRGLALQVATVDGLGGLINGIDLYGTGSIVTSAGRQSFNLINRHLAIQTYSSVSSVQALTWRPDRHTAPTNAGSALKINITASGAASAIGIDLTLDMSSDVYIGDSSGINGKGGDSLDLVIERTDLQSATFSMVWPANFRFSGNDANLPSSGPFKVRIEFMFDGAEWLAKRTDY